MSVTWPTAPTPSVRTAAASAVRDLLAHPLPLVAANVLWGVVAFGAWLAATIAEPLGVLLALLLTWPTATIAAIACRVARGGEPVLRDAFRWPVGRPAVGVLGALALACAVVGVVDVQAALARGDLIGIAFATLAGWGLVALGILACVLWPLVGDPARAELGIASLLRLAATIALVRTPRVVVAWLMVGTLLAVSLVLAAAVVTVSVSLAASFLARMMLPLADEIEPTSGA